MKWFYILVQNYFTNLNIILVKGGADCCRLQCVGPGWSYFFFNFIVDQNFWALSRPKSSASLCLEPLISIGLLVPTFTCVIPTHYPMLVPSIASCLSLLLPNVRPFHCFMFFLSIESCQSHPFPHVIPIHCPMLVPSIATCQSHPQPHVSPIHCPMLVPHIAPCQSFPLPFPHVSFIHCPMVVPPSATVSSNHCHCWSHFLLVPGWD